MPRLLTLLILLAGLALSAQTSVNAETLAEARAAVSADLASKDPEKRAYAVERLAATGDHKAIPIIFDTLAKERDSETGERMGRALAPQTGPKSLEQIEKRITNNMKGSKFAFNILWVTIGLLEARNEDADKMITRLISELDKKRIFARTAMIEGIAIANRDDLSEPVAAFVESYDKLYESNPLAVITAATTLRQISNSENQYRIVLALAEAMNLYKNEKIQRFAATTCGAISGLRPIISGDYWRYWAQNKGNMEAETGHVGKTSTAKPKPKFFGTEAVGQRIVFVIDNSGSMSAPISIRAPIPEKRGDPPSGPETGGRGEKKDEEEDEKDKVPPPDYSKVRTKLDLAKVELIHTLKQLDEDYVFNIVYYSTTHDHLITSERGLVKATEANKARFIKAVQDLPVAGATNIHGALMRGFRTTTKGEITKEDTATSQTCILEGAETVFFLTDGFANVDDGVSGAAGPIGTAGGGIPKFAVTKNILADVARVNTFRKSVINTVGIGPHDQDLLRGLASQSGGDYRDMSGF